MMAKFKDLIEYSFKVSRHNHLYNYKLTQEGTIMAERFPNPQNKDQILTQHTEQNAAVGKASEWSTTGQASSAKQPTNEERRQEIREVYKHGQATPSQQSHPKLEEFRQRLLQDNQQKLRDAVAKRDDASRNPSQRPSRPSL
jgi:hypothetical protein